MTGRLAGRRAVVTGGAANIGRAIVTAFLREGASVLIADINASDAEATASELSNMGTVSSIGCDVTNRDQVQALAATAIERLGGVDILVNNAGLAGRMPLEKFPEDQMDRLLAVNVKGPLLCSQAFIPALTEVGKAGADAVIINMSSQAGKRGWAGLSVYSASKSAVLGMNRSLAVELAPHVRVNAICPGHIDATGMAWRGWSEKGEVEGVTAREVAEKFTAENVPLQRLQSTDDIANSALFLASAEASEITGAAINVGGGVVMD